MIKAVIFDCFGVLTTDTWRAFTASLPANVDVEAARELNRSYDAGLITKAAFLKGVHEITGHEPRQVETLLDNEITKNTELLNYIQELKKSYKIGLLSNVGTPWITDAFLDEAEQKLFDAMIFSYQAGMTKPDHRIFKLACDKLGVQHEEAVMIDDIDRYCSEARAVGLSAVCYQDITQMKSELEHILHQA